MEVSDNVKDIKVGDRVAFYGSDSYAEYTVVPESRIVVIPDQLSFDDAASILLQGMTAQYLVKSTFQVKKGDTVLIHAAAGGMGLLLCSLCNHLGAYVIGTCSTEEKAAKAKTHGAHEVILYSQTDFLKGVLNLTQNKGVDVVYDGVGKDTFLKGLDCLKPRGTMVLYGGASGPVDPIDPMILSKKGSIFLTRPSLHHYTLTTEELRERASDVFKWAIDKVIKINVGASFPLSEASSAHNALEGRETMGKILLKP